MTTNKVLSTPSCRRPLTNRGFTLVELLVVVAVIGLLAAILFPVFSTARENGRRTACESNLKQIGMAITQYVQDADEYYPIGEAIPTGANTDSRTCVTAVALQYPPRIKSLTLGSTPDYFWSWMSVIYAYTKSTQIYYCPSGPTVLDGANWTPTMVNEIDYGYAYNPMVLQTQLWRISAPTNTISDYPACAILDPAYAARTMAASRFSAPAAAVMMADRGQTSSNALYCLYSPQLTYACSNASGWSEGNDTIGFNPDQGYNPSLRHFQGSNFLFIDGHVKFLTFAQYYANRGTTTQPGLLNAGIQ